MNNVRIKFEALHAVPPFEKEIEAEGALCVMEHDESIEVLIHGEFTTMLLASRLIGIIKNLLPDFPPAIRPIILGTLYSQLMEENNTNEN